MADGLPPLLPRVSEEAASMAHMALMSGATQLEELLGRIEQDNPIITRIMRELSEGMGDEELAGFTMGAVVVYSLLEVQAAGEMGEWRKQHRR